MDLGDATLSTLYCMEFGRLLKAHNLVTMQCNITKLDKRTHVHTIFLVVGFISQYDAI